MKKHECGHPRQWITASRFLMPCAKCSIAAHLTYEGVMRIRFVKKTFIKPGKFDGPTYWVLA